MLVGSRVAVVSRRTNLVIPEDGSLGVRVICVLSPMAFSEYWQTGNSAFTGAYCLTTADAQLFEHLTDEAVFLADQCAKQVNRLDLRVAVTLSHLLCALQRFKGLLGETVGVQSNHPPLLNQD